MSCKRVWTLNGAFKGVEEKITETEAVSTNIKIFRLCRGHLNTGLNTCCKKHFINTCHTKDNITLKFIHAKVGTV